VDHADPSRRPRPGINLDNLPFWDGARAHELRVQRCGSCGAAQFPPLPVCGECTSDALEWVPCSGRGVLYSYAIPHHPQAPGFDYPVIVALVELEEGARLVSNLVDIERDELRVGMAVEVCWLDSHPALAEDEWDSRGPITLPQFRPATGATVGS
jgi:uncharacterized OB-fold protein